MVVLFLHFRNAKEHMKNMWFARQVDMRKTKLSEGERDTAHVEQHCGARHPNRCYAHFTGLKRQKWGAFDTPPPSLQGTALAVKPR